jgi:hypothetical protein
MKQQLLKTIFLGLFFISSSVFAAGSGVFEDHPYEFLIKKTISQFSESYTISPLPQGESVYGPTYTGVVKKSAFRIRTNYDLSDQNGWQATGITRILSMGMMYSWATDIDIYDTRNVKIGFIDGSIATVESARYDLYSYDEEGQAIQVGVALANVDFTNFSISTPGNYLPIGELNRDLKNNFWTVTITEPGVIDDRIIRIFAGFVVNYQDKFLTKNLSK